MNINAKHALLLTAVSIFFSASFSGCVSGTSINQVAIAKPVEVKALDKKKPIMFKKMVVKVKRGEEIGTVYEGLFDIPRTKLLEKGRLPQHLR